MDTKDRAKQDAIGAGPQTANARSKAEETAGTASIGARSFYERASSRVRPHSAHAERTGRRSEHDQPGAGPVHAYERSRGTQGAAPDPVGYSPRDEWRRDGTYEAMGRYGYSPMTGTHTSAREVDARGDDRRDGHREPGRTGPPEGNWRASDDHRGEREWYQGASRQYGFRAPGEMGPNRTPGQDTGTRGTYAQPGQYDARGGRDDRPTGGPPGRDPGRPTRDDTHEQREAGQRYEGMTSRGDGRGDSRR